MIKPAQGHSPGVRTVTAALLLAANLAASAGDTLAGRFSKRFHALESEIAEIDRELATLPDIPQDDSGGAGAYAKYHASASADEDLSADVTIRFIWDEPASIDLIALIPARKFTTGGLEPEFGFPDDYSISLIDTSGATLAKVADARSTGSSPSVRGLPYLHRVDEAIEASGIELRIARLRPARPDGPPIQFFALAEVFCFSGERNLARKARISFNYDKWEHTSPYWSPDFMTDEFTPLGLPEAPLPNRETAENIGWITNGADTPDQSAWIRVDLGKPMTIDGFRIFPAIRPSLVTVPGFGIPSRFLVESSLLGDPESFTTVATTGTLDQPNPGNNPLTERFPPVTARFVQLRTERLWKPFQHYPAFLASSEIQVLRGEENLALGAPVSVSENREPLAAEGGHFWSAESLTDGNGPQGTLLTRKTWLEQLGRRKLLEIRKNEHVREMTRIEQTWKLTTTTLLLLLGLVGLLAVAILPFRFRLRERRKIRGIRDRIAGDLHDDVGSNLGSIQLLAGAARDKVDNREDLGLIHQIAAETVSSVRDIVWLLRPKPGERASTISHLRESASFMLESIDWEFTSELEDFAVSDEDGRNLVLFFREALHNLIRHSGAKNADIRLFNEGEELCLEIEDDGRGIPPEDLQKESTLRALKQRSKSLNGRLEIQSEAGRGTLLRLRFTPQSPTASQTLRYPFSGTS